MQILLVECHENATVNATHPGHTTREEVVKGSGHGNQNAPQEGHLFLGSEHYFENFRLNIVLKGGSE